ncbi:MAG: CHASE2 domain-containing protein, partial [Pseudomonadales bacterium]
TQPGMWLRDYRLDIGFDGPPGHVRRISYADALYDTPLIAGLAGKFVLVGMTAAGLGHTLATPVSGTAQPMAGVEFQANVLANLRHGNWIRTVHGGPHALLLALVALLPALCYPRLEPRQGMFTGAALLLVTLTVPVALLALGNVWIAPAPALLALLASYPLWSWWRIEATVKIYDIAALSFRFVRSLIVHKSHAKQPSFLRLTCTCKHSF